VYTFYMSLFWFIWTKREQSLELDEDKLDINEHGLTTIIPFQLVQHLYCTILDLFENDFSIRR